MDDTLNEYKVADRKPWFAESKRRGGLSLMHPLAIGVISAVINDCHRTSYEKVLEIKGVLADMGEVWKDESIPDGYLDVKKPLLQTEAEKEISQVDCTIDIAKAESLIMGNCETCLLRHPR